MGQRWLFRDKTVILIKLPKINGQMTKITFKYAKISQNGTIYRLFVVVYEIGNYIVILGYKSKKFFFLRKSHI